MAKPKDEAASARVLTLNVPPSMPADELAKIEIRPPATQQDADFLGRIFRTCSDKIRLIEERYDDATKQAHAMHKAVIKLKTDEAAPYVAVRDAAKRELGRWEEAKWLEAERIRAEAEKKRREEEARLQREAEEKARAAREAEAARIKALEEAEEARKAGDVAAQLKAEENAETFGQIAEEAQVEAVEASQEASAVATAAIVVPVAKTAGAQTRETWKAQVFDLRALCAAIGRGELPESYVEPNMTALNARARSDKGMMRVPGVRPQREIGIASGRKS